LIRKYERNGKAKALKKVEFYSSFSLRSLKIEEEIYFKITSKEKAAL
jgi:hypothetical protein